MRFQRFVIPCVVLLVPAGLASCSESSASVLAVRVDTLPGGITRTMTEHPIDSGRWRLVADRDIQPPELDPAELVSPADLALAADGSVIVADSKPAVIKVYGPDGAFVRAFGRQGSGPGEFNAAYIAVLGDTLVVQDPRNARATSFNWRTGAMLTERRTACCYYAPVSIDQAGRAAVRAMPPTSDTAMRNAQAFVRFPVNGTVAETTIVNARYTTFGADPWVVREGDRIHMMVTVPNQPTLALSVDPRGGFLVGWSGEYLIRRSRTGTDTAALFGRPYVPAVITPAEKQSIVDRRIAAMRLSNPAGPSEAVLRASFDPTRIPDTRPAFERTYVDDVGRLWVRRSDSDSTVVRFDLFDREGRWLDVLELRGGWPRDIWVSVAIREHAAAVILEGDDGRPLIRVYRIVRRDG